VRSTPAAIRPLALGLAALGLSLAYAPFPLRFFAFVAFIPLLWTIERAAPGRAFGWGWLFGTLAAGFHFWWLWFLVVPVSPLTRFLLNVGVVLLFAYLGLFTGIFALLVRRLGVWSAPLVWPLVEFARAATQLAFPWDLLGYTMTPWTPLIQPAALGGVWLVSAWLILVNVIGYRLLFPPGAGHFTLRAVSPRRAAALLAAFLVPLAFGAVRLRVGTPWFRVAIVQPDVDPLDKGDWDSRERIIADLKRLTRAAVPARPDLVLFPETATLVDVTRSTTIGPDLARLADSLDVEIFTGSPLFDAPQQQWYNGAALIRPGEFPPAQTYRKMRLVPFSEKIPYADEVPFLRKLVGTSDMGDWGRGRVPTVFEWRKGTLGCLICYEAIFPDQARALTTRGADLLAIVTNDGWFGRIIGAQQHAEIAVLRAVENGVPIVRSANNGISYVVDPWGRITGATPLFTQTLLAGDVLRPLAPTPYRRWGDWFLVACLAAVVAIAAKRLAGGIAARRARNHARG
jgi:apolipoprotein N-acyltransferase